MANQELDEVKKDRWDNIPINNLPPRTSKAAPEGIPAQPSAAAQPSAPVQPPAPKAPAEAPGPKAPVEAPPRMPRGPVIGGGPGIFGPELVPLPGSEDTLPTLGTGEAEEDS
ncbi:hypothetical protein JNN96_15135 [Mycobacterium sp. DSM 3803]|nr:hypothetical protein [Mycobacterium sp. DSM 3803]OKH64907.1 hypothetical protein EB73_22600 [Mycobacterium sp. SWH-M3]